jgi:hypothetical protein
MATDPDMLEGRPGYSENLENKASREDDQIRDVKGDWVETTEDNSAAEAIEEEYGPIEPRESMEKDAEVKPFIEEDPSPRISSQYPSVAHKPYERKPDW